MVGCIWILSNNRKNYGNNVLLLPLLYIVLFLLACLVSSEVWLMSSVWQVQPGTQPGQKVVMKRKGIRKGMHVDISWSFGIYEHVAAWIFNRCVFSVKWLLSSILSCFLLLTGTNSFKYGDQYVHFNVNIPTWVSYNMFQGYFYNLCFSLCTTACLAFKVPLFEIMVIGIRQCMWLIAWFETKFEPNHT
jgi:hypothetical protein